MPCWPRHINYWPHNIACWLHHMVYWPYHTVMVTPGSLRFSQGGYHFTLIKVGNTKNGDSRKLQPLYVGLFFCCSLLYLYGNLVKLNLIIFMASFTEKLNDDSIAT